MPKREPGQVKAGGGQPAEHGLGAASVSFLNKPVTERTPLFCAQ